MPKKPTYEELEQRLKELDKEAVNWKRTGEALRKSEKRFKNVTNSIEELIVLLDQNFKIQLINKTLAEAYNVSLDKYAGKHCYELFYGRNDICEDCPAIKVFNDGKVIRGVLRYRPDGRIYDRTVYPFIEDNGDITGVIVIGVDITEQKQAEEALLEKERFLQNVFDGMQDGISVLDPELNIIRVNQWMEKVYGDHKALIGKKCYEVYQQRESICPWCPSVKAINTGEPQSEIVPYPTKENPEGWIDLTSHPMKDAENRVSAVIEHVKDITDRKRTEEALRESEEKYRLLVESTPDWVWMCDRKSRHTFSNNSVKKILGYEIHEILGTAAFSLIHKEDRESVQKWFQNAKKQKRGWRGSVIRWQHKDKSIRFLETIAEPIFDDKGNLIGYSGIDRDVTARKLSEMALQKAHDELQEKTIRLEVKKNSLEEINTAMKVLLKKREEDKTELEDNVLTNVKKLIVPYFEKIKKTKLDAQQEAFLSIIESNLNEIISPFTRKMSLKYLNLTPTEIRIANLIRHGSSSKEIAELLYVSPRTVETHRKNIRRKIGLKRKRANLRSHLLSLN